MKNITSGTLLLLFPFLLLIPGCQKENVTPVLAKHEKQYPEIRKKYVYQSLIRLANIKKDPDFEKLIKDVNKVILYLPPSGDSTYQIKDVRNGLPADGYETLVDVRTADAQRISLWVKESNTKSHYIALMDAADQDVILEIDGQINIEYLSAINVADEGSLLKLLEGGF
ncbi:MAG: DUF4252 domain-containing protein [Saprospiraceae bacterium]|nr:DUF4252 domain-containing protein [Candidatus Opimibacter skivensis]MBP6681220.1 DUF4252 domain-containing protein [Saprospiraceae bacterium]